MVPIKGAVVGGTYGPCRRKYSEGGPASPLWRRGSKEGAQKAEKCFAREEKKIGSERGEEKEDAVPKSANNQGAGQKGGGGNA